MKSEITYCIMSQKIKILILIVSFLSFSFLSYSQNGTANEIKMAKEMAKKQGYSEKEIEKMFTTSKKGEEIKQNDAELELMRSVTKDGVVAMRMDTTLFKKMAHLDSLKKVEANKIKIYGHEMFESTYLNFIPSLNIPTPSNYVLAPGDEVVLDIWGASYLHLTETISPEGSINIPEIGPVYLIGYTIQKAQNHLKSYLSKYYSGLEKSENTYIRLALGKIRTITINVVGDVKKPGTYTLPSLSTILSGLYLAGGPTDVGTLRNIKLYRGNKLVTTFDLYSFFFEGNVNSSVRLEDNDVLIVGEYVNLVKIVGAIKRPMVYEINKNETVEDLLKYSGGFKGEANSTIIHINRVVGTQMESHDVPSENFSSFVINDGDSVTVMSNRLEYKNEVHLSGAVVNAGSYSISDSIGTLSKLLKVAGGIREDAYLDRGYIQRLAENKDTLGINFVVRDILDGTNDVLLSSGDSIKIFPSQELVDYQYIITTGELNKPDTLSFMKGMTIGDAILLSKGFKTGASRSNIDVARRIVRDINQTTLDTISIVYNLDFINNKNDINFELSPFDIILVRNMPQFKEQQTITISGEVLFPGEYVVEKNIVRLSDIVNKAGGINSDAYSKGAVLIRKFSDEEYSRLKLAIKISKKQAGTDSTLIEDIDRNEGYRVGIDFDEALSKPGSYSDVILKTGDKILIPKMNNTVKISGAVLFKNVVSYNPSLSPKDYVNLAGGYMKHAMKRHTYIVYMNGKVSKKGTSNFIVEPGCEIVVPMKDIDGKNRVSAAEVASIASSTASVATMVVSIVSLLKK